MRPLLALFSTLLVTAAVAPAGATPTKQDLDRTGSPYFVVKGASGDADAMPLESTRADIHVAGTIASVKVTQVYKNDGKETLEAIYVFPGSTRSAVFGMRMTVGGRTIVAEIQKKEEARKLYEAAKAEGKSASLLEQDRPNVFTMNVANILPGDRITVELDYTELLVPEAGVYELVYPAVVGPRFTGESGSAEPFTATPYTHQGDKPSYGWDVTATIAAGLPIKRVTSSSHPISTTLSDDGATATVTLPNKGAAGTKDFVLQYRLAGDQIASGVLLFEDQGERFFMTLVQPPARVAPKAMPNREYIFILDVSGSMSGFPLETAKKAMYGLFKGMKPTDRFNIMEFESTPRLLSPESLPATPANIKAAEAKLRASSGGGGTRILEALRKALALPTPASFSRTFVVVTDGYISVEPEVFELIADNLGNANLFAFGIGSSVNRFLIEGMARVGMGEPFIAMHGDDAAEKAQKLIDMIDAPALTNIRVAFKGFDAYDVEPKTVPDLFAARPVLVFGKYRGKAAGTIEVTGLSGEGKFVETLNVADYKPSAGNEALRYLWARHRIAALADLNRLQPSDARVKEVTELGLAYHLMTDYTSFVAVDEVVRNVGGKTTTVRQPLPLPQGVEDSAIGGGVAGEMGRMGSVGRGRAAAAAPRPMKMTERPAPTAATALDDGGAPSVREPKTDTAGPLRVVRATRVTSANAAAKAGVEAWLRSHRGTLEGVLRSAGVGMAAGKLVVELTFGPSGQIAGARILSADAGGRAAAGRGLLAALRKMTTSLAAQATVTVELTLGS